MATILNADTVVGGAVVTGDASGVLALQSGGVTGLTVSSGGAVAFSGTVSGIPGGGGAAASGSVVLTSASGGAQSITTTGYGQSVTLPDATTVSEGASLYIIKNEGLFDLKIVNAAGTTKGFIRPLQTTTVGLSDNSTSAGTWVFSNTEILGVTAFNQYASSQSVSILRCINIDSDRDLLLISATSGVYGTLYNKTTGSWGTLTLIRTVANATMTGIKTATDQVLVVSCLTTALQAVVLTLSGTTITVGTAATATLAGSISELTSFVSGGIAQVGSTFIFSYTRQTTIGAIRGITISGTTATIGSEVTVTGTQAPARTYTVSSSVLLAISITGGSTITCAPYTVSGTTLTLGTAVTLTSTSNDSTVYTMPLGTRWAVVYLNSNSTASIINVTGTTATASTATLNAISFLNRVVLVGSKIVVVSLDTVTMYLRYFSDNAGTINVSNAITQVASFSYADVFLFPIDANTAGISYYRSNSQSFLSTVDVSTTTPVLSLKTQNVIAGTANNIIVTYPSTPFYGLTNDLTRSLYANGQYISIDAFDSGRAGNSLYTKNGMIILPTMLTDVDSYVANGSNNYTYFTNVNGFSINFSILEMAQ